MKQFTDGNNKFPLENKGASYAGSPPTAENFNGITAELVNVVRHAGFPLDPLSGTLEGSDNHSLMDSESNKQIVRSIDHMDQQTYLRSVQDNNRIMQYIVGQSRIHGLEVVKTDTLTVSIAPGLGYTSLGQAVFLETAAAVDLSSEASEEEHIIEIGLKYSIQAPDYIIGADNLLYKAQEIVAPVFGALLDADVLPIAKITIDNTGITNILMTAPYSEKQNFKDFKRSFPIGYQYTLYADEDSSSFNPAKYPTAMFGTFGNWNIIYQSKSAFFRTEGTEARTGRGDDGIQMDSLQAHIHKTHIGGHNHSTDIGSHSHIIPDKGRIQGTPNGSHHHVLTTYYAGGARTQSTYIGPKTSNWVDYGIKDSQDPYGTNVRTASETRVKNALIRIYELVSYKELY